MQTSMHYSCFIQSIVLLFIVIFSVPVQCQLDEDLYDDTCPNLTKLVRYGVWSAIRNETRMAASLLRLHFHDCFVNGCDGSILLDDTSTLKGEKNASPNRNSVRGFEVIDDIKASIEKVCPSTVSCVDILTLAAREAVYLTGGPYWSVALGRRDGTTASESAANEQIPGPSESLPVITAKFTSKGLNAKDVVVLSGAHTIGFAQCFTFKQRLFNFKSSGKPDPALDSSLLQGLTSLCPNSDASDNQLAPLDPVTTNKFDNVYFKNLLNNSGLLESDQALMGDSDAASMVENYSKYPYQFFKDFGASMVKMANIGVLTGDEGQIRKNCRAVN
ncbi:peroxidase 10-like protein [Cinnamomum micranthum f. kanehirae]|uniref:Peroxidase n=1 Tax=Cinnamomum micranthum f. kanehirae TaxID=337451 RepID=A0A3S3MCL1_9MAGN|nr:peroxidase 10-like protein [Cinnamomum micranthum f. kanehirae]